MKNLNKQIQKSNLTKVVEAGYLIFYCPDCQDEVCRLFLHEPNEHLVVRCACGTIASLIHVDVNELKPYFEKGCKSPEPTKRSILGKVSCREDALQLSANWKKILEGIYEYSVSLDQHSSSKQHKRRLHQLTKVDISAWQKARLKKGQEKYKDSHLKRYSLVDVMEELLDAQNILALGIERITKNMKSNKDALKYAPALFESNTLWNRINSAIEDIIELDQKLPDDVCTDEKGGLRIWWEASND